MKFWYIALESQFSVSFFVLYVVLISKIYHFCKLSNSHGVDLNCVYEWKNTSWIINVLSHVQALIKSQTLEVTSVTDILMRSAGQPETRPDEKHHFFSLSLSCSVLCFLFLNNLNSCFNYSLVFVCLKSPIIFVQQLFLNLFKLAYTVTDFCMNLHLYLILVDRLLLTHLLVTCSSVTCLPTLPPVLHFPFCSTVSPSSALEDPLCHIHWPTSSILVTHV